MSPTKEILDSFYRKWVEHDFENDSNCQISGNVCNQLEKGSIEDIANSEFIPNKTLEDDFINASSIAIILWLPNFSILLLGDSRPEIIIESLKTIGYNDTDKRLKVDYIKVSHHGSKNNTSMELLNYIECDNFIFSTNGGFARSKHPDRETIARILCRKSRNMKNTTVLYFNYPISTIENKAGKFITEEELRLFNCIIRDNINILPYE